MTVSNLDVRPANWVLPENVSFVLGLDLDNVCADYDDAFRRHVAKVLGVPVDSLGPVHDWDFAKIGWGIKDRAHFEELHQGAVREGMFRTMKPVEGVQAALKEISDAGVHIRVVTHRLFIKGLHGQSAGDTVDWLESTPIPYRSLCMVERKSDIEADLFIDDAPHNIMALRKARKKAAVFDQLYNQHVRGLRVKGWADAKEKVLDLAYQKALALS